MAPLQPYRTATTTRRSARSGFVPEQDDFEGLPVRQWRRQWVTVATTPPNDTNEEGDIWAEDPSHGMPKDSHLLIPCLQELLRAGRSINFGKRPAPDDDDDGDYDGYGVVEKREEEEENQGFMIQTWKQVPRTAETPSTSHLAKRHKNTITLSSKVGVPSVTGPTVTRATVRRIDAAGNPYEQTITLTEGQKVDGEIISTTVVPASQPKAQDTELSTNQPTPNRRRPPPPKRKPPRGPGRGRKKRLPLPLPLPATRSQQHADHDGSPDVKTEGDPEEAARTDDNEDSTMQDSEMADESGFQSDDDAEGVDDDMDPDDTAEAQDGAADEPTPEVGELGDNTEVAADLVQEQYQDQDQDQDHEMLDSDATEILQPSSVEEPDDAASSPAGGPGVRRSSSGEEELTISKPRFQPSLGLGALASFGSPRVEGSPLKNVMTHSPPDRRSPVLAGASPSADLASAAAAAAPSVSAKAEESFDSPGVPMDVDMTDDAHSQVGVEVIKTVKMEETEEPPLHFQPEASVVGETTTPPVVTKQNDTLPESAAAVSAVTVTETTTTTTTTVVMDDSVLPAAEEGDATMASPVHLSAPVPAAVGPELQVPELSLPPIDSGSVSGVAVEGAAEQAEGEADGEDDDDGLNLLGSLEAELDRQESLSNAPGSRADTPKQQQQQQPLPAGAAAAVEGEDGAEKDDESGEMKDVVEGRDETGTDVNKEPEDVQHEMKDAEEKDQIESDATEEEMKKGVAGGEGDETAAESDINKEVEDVQHEMKDDVGEREDQNKSTGSDDGSEGVNDAEDVEKIKDVVVDDLADMETVAKEDAKDVKEGDADTGGMGAAIATEESEAGGQAS